MLKKLGELLAIADRATPGSWINDEFIAAFNPTTARALVTSLMEAMKALESISKNGCCETCQQAKLVALSSLAKIGG